MYLSGANTRRLKGALKPLLRAAPLSRSAVSRVVQSLKDAVDRWRQRRLDHLDVAYVYLDAIALRIRQAGRVVSTPVLVAVAVLTDGNKQLVALEMCGSESQVAWKGFLDDLVARGLTRPHLCIIDGCPGLRSALDLVWAKVTVQRCAVHKLRNLERKAPKHALHEMKADYHRIVYAADAAAARAAYDDFVTAWRKRCPGVVRSLDEAGEELLTCYRFPKSQWKTLRTTNVIERLNGEFRRRVKTQASLPTEDAALIDLALQPRRQRPGQAAPHRRLARHRARAQPKRAADGESGSMRSCYTAARMRPLTKARPLDDEALRKIGTERGAWQMRASFLGAQALPDLRLRLRATFRGCCFAILTTLIVLSGCHPAPKPSRTLTEAESPRPQIKTEPLRDNEVLTPWPSVLPCEVFARIVADITSESEERFEWIGPRARLELTGRYVLGLPPRGRPAPGTLARERPSRLAWGHDVPPIVTLTARCADGWGAIEWTCGRLPRDGCTIEVRYPRPPLTGTRGRDCPDRYHARAALAPVERMRPYLDDALTLIGRVCAGGRCSALVDGVVPRLRALRAVAPWQIEPVFPTTEWKLTSDKESVELSCNEQPVTGFDRCMLEIDDFAYQQEESLRDCAAGGENLLLPNGIDFIREEARGFVIGGTALH